MLEQSCDSIEVRIGIGIVPRPHSEQCQNVNEVVVEENREMFPADRCSIRQAAEILKDIDGNGFRHQLRRLPIPVAKDMKSVLLRPAVVFPDQRVKLDRFATCPESV